MRRISPISSIIHEDLTYADADLDDMYQYMEKLEVSLHAAYDTLREIDTYWTLPYVSDPGIWGADQTDREKYLRRIMMQMRERASNAIKMMDQIISIESRGDQ